MGSFGERVMGGGRGGERVWFAFGRRARGARQRQPPQCHLETRRPIAGWTVDSTTNTPNSNETEGELSNNSTGRFLLPPAAPSLGDLAHGVCAASPCPCRGCRLVAVLPSPGSSSELRQGGAAKSVPTLEATFEHCHVTEVKEPCWPLKFRLICRSCCGEWTRGHFDCSECSVHDALHGFGPRCACCYFWLLDWPQCG